MPAEWASHSQCWLLWPVRTDNWRDSCKPAQEAFWTVAVAISQFEPVTIAAAPVSVADIEQRIQQLTNLVARDSVTVHNINRTLHPIRVISMEYDDCWMRDVGPTFLVRVDRDRDTSNDSEIAAVDWAFNAWGEKYSSWAMDDQVAGKVIQDTNTETSFRTDFILEGGSIHVDGEGTVLTTEQCLLNKNRNPHLSKEQITTYLLDYLGAEKVIWLPRGLTADHDTDGHIDNICCFAQPGVVLLSWTDTETDEFYDICREAYDVLTNTTDARGRYIKVIKLPIPEPMYYSESDCAGLQPTSLCYGGNDEDSSSYLRQVGERLAASYVNFYVANGGIVCPKFGQPSDEVAFSILKEAFPKHQVVQVLGKDILLGGGNIHCITQQQPK